MHTTRSIISINLEYELVTSRRVFNAHCEYFRRATSYILCIVAIHELAR